MFQIIVEWPDDQTRLRIFNAMLLVLPSENHALLRLLLLFIAEHVAANPSKKKCVL